MTKKTPKNMTTAELTDALLHAAYKMPTTQMVTKRAALLCSKMSATDSKRLPLCYGESHCGLLSCIRCRMREQRAFMAKMLPLIKEAGGQEAWRAITIVPEFGMTEVGALPKGGLRGFKNQISAAIRKASPNACVAMSVDVNVERRVGEKEVWQFHGHGIITNLEADAIDQVYKRFSWRKKSGDSDGSCYRPVHTDDIYDLVGYLAYMSKPQFFQRQQRPDAHGDLKFGRKTITIEQELEFVKVLSRFKTSQRIFYIGMDNI